jgi:hypothetical protein
VFPACNNVNFLKCRAVQQFGAGIIGTGLDRVNFSSKSTFAHPMRFMAWDMPPDENRLGLKPARRIVN